MIAAHEGTILEVNVGDKRAVPVVSSVITHALRDAGFDNVTFTNQQEEQPALEKPRTMLDAIQATNPGLLKTPIAIFELIEEDADVNYVAPSAEDTEEEIEGAEAILDGPAGNF